MIRFFYAFGKSKFNKFSDLTLFSQSTDAFKAHHVVCPSCGAKHACSDFTSYSRHMISFENGSTICRDVLVARVICSSCTHTHAVLPDILIPFGSYSLSFVLTVLKCYFFRKSTVIALCADFHISVSTLYGWIHLFHLQKQLWFGVLLNASVSSLDFLEGLFLSGFSLPIFFLTFNASFMEQPKATRFNSS
jgi:hypothetical protein